MSEQHDELHLLVQQLRNELTWAMRTGIEFKYDGPPRGIATTKPRKMAPPPQRRPKAPTNEPPPPGKSAKKGKKAEEKKRPAPSPQAQAAPPPPMEEPPPPMEPPPYMDEAPPPPPKVREDLPRGAPPWARYMSASEYPANGKHRPSQAPPPPVEAAAPESPAELEVDSWAIVDEQLSKADSLPVIQEIIGEDCQRCKLSGLGRKNIVFGVGNPQADIMFVGEGPGAQEDRQGEPFVGDAGQLLTKIIEGGMKIQRSEVYIANIVKCRPPRNRDPEPDEVEACERFLRAQIKAIKPKIIIALGRYAAQTILRSKTPISRLRGQWKEYEGIPLMPTFHPAYLLRNPAEKRPVWNDIQEVLKRMESMEG